MLRKQVHEHFTIIFSLTMELISILSKKDQKIIQGNMFADF